LRNPAATRPALFGSLANIYLALGDALTEIAAKLTADARQNAAAKTRQLRCSLLARRRSGCPSPGRYRQMRELDGFAKHRIFERLASQFPLELADALLGIGKLRNGNGRHAHIHAAKLPGPIATAPLRKLARIDSVLAGDDRDERPLFEGLEDDSDAISICQIARYAGPELH